MAFYQRFFFGAALIKMQIDVDSPKTETFLLRTAAAYTGAQIKSNASMLHVLKAAWYFLKDKTLLL